MKLYIVILFLVAYESFAHDVTISEIRNGWRRAIAPFEDECIHETGVKAELIDDFYTYGKMSDDPCWRCFLQCVNVKLQVSTSTGEVNVKQVSETFDYVDLSIVEKCNKISELDPCKKTHLFVKVFKKQARLERIGPYPSLSNTGFKLDVERKNLDLIYLSVFINLGSPLRTSKAEHLLSCIDYMRMLTFRAKMINTLV
ncbi:hypothetical protein ILUMI_01592 [Ignelater luminosus]|uniref:Uncharacterized protein n=1 Tax=Ignelater luminosus TaxID=2038154 RepID=A0A8K0DI77_IGNLU|nr:hypothetical protein ILUMI_01592 [Ignelater luminosus]